jgi:hypothetical protein
MSYPARQVARLESLQGTSAIHYLAPGDADPSAGPKGSASVRKPKLHGSCPEVPAASLALPMGHEGITHA